MPQLADLIAALLNLLTAVAVLLLVLYADVPFTVAQDSVDEPQGL